MPKNDSSSLFYSDDTNTFFPPSCDSSAASFIGALVVGASIARSAVRSSGVVECWHHVSSDAVIAFAP